MNYLSLSLLAFAAGILLAIQGALNAQLSVQLKSPLLASLVASFFSVFFALAVVLFSIKDVPNLQQIKAIPLYLWFTGALFSVTGVSLYYFTIPKLGISTMISLGLCGQLIFSFFAGHFGFLGLPTEPIDIKRTVGIIAMIVGILLVNIK